MTQQMVGTELTFTQGLSASDRQILSDEAIEFLAELVGKFTPQRNKLLAARADVQAGPARPPRGDHWPG